MKIIIDRIEEGFAVCEDVNTRGTLNIPIGSLPEGASAGDVLIRGGNGFIIDRKTAKSRRRRIDKAFKDLLKND